MASLPQFVIPTEADPYWEIPFRDAAGAPISLEGRVFEVVIAKAETRVGVGPPPAALKTLTYQDGLLLVPPTDASGSSVRNTLVHRVSREFAQATFPRGDLTASILEVIGSTRRMLLPVKLRYADAAEIRDFTPDRVGVIFGDGRQPILTPVAVAGQAGPRGAGFLSGPRPPVAGDGENGDFWINTAADIRLLYGPKAGGAWPAGSIPITSTITPELEALRDEVVAVSAELIGIPAPPEGRLSLTSGVALTTSDVIGATRIHYVPASGANLWLYDGTRWRRIGFSALSLDLSQAFQAGGNIYDLFVVNDAGTLRLGTGPAWASATARGTGAGSTELQPLDGLLTNKLAMALRWGPAAGAALTAAPGTALYVGSVYVEAGGQAADTQTRRHLFNAYNQDARPWSVTDPVASYQYSLAAWRVTNCNPDNRVQVLAGLPGVLAEAEACSLPYSSTPDPVAIYTGIGINSTSVNAGDSEFVSFRGTNLPISVRSRFRGFLPLGLNSINWLESGGGSAQQTWFGSSYDTTTYWTGLRGRHFA